MLPFQSRGGQLLLACSRTGIADLRAVTEPGWGGRWALTGFAQVMVWFTRDDEVLQIRLSCAQGVPAIQEVPAGSSLLPTSPTGPSTEPADTGRRSTGDGGDHRRHHSWHR